VVKDGVSKMGIEEIAEDRIVQFIKYVKTQADDTSVFAYDEIKKSELYKELSKEYNNIDELVDKVWQKSDLYYKSKEWLEKNWEKCIKMRAYRDPEEKLAEYLVFHFAVFCSKITENVRIDWYDRFVFKYGRDKLLGLCLKVVRKYPNPHEVYENEEKKQANRKRGYRHYRRRTEERRTNASDSAPIQIEKEPSVRFKRKRSKRVDKEPRKIEDWRL